MKRPAAVGVVLALFLVGVAVGVMGANLFNHHRVRTGGPSGIHAMEAERIRALETELKQRLHLRPDQEPQVAAILADAHRESWALFQEVRPRIAAVLKRSEDRINQLLDADQKQEYERFRQDRVQERAAHRRLRGGRPDAGPPPPLPAPPPR